MQLERLVGGEPDAFAAARVAILIEMGHGDNPDALPARGVREELGHPGTEPA